MRRGKDGRNRRKRRGTAVKGRVPMEEPRQETPLPEKKPIDNIISARLNLRPETTNDPSSFNTTTSRPIQSDPVIHPILHSKILSIHIHRRARRSPFVPLPPSNFFFESGASLTGAYHTEGNIDMSGARASSLSGAQVFIIYTFAVHLSQKYSKDSPMSSVWLYNDFPPSPTRHLELEIVILIMRAPCLENADTRQTLRHPG